VVDAEGQSLHCGRSGLSFDRLASDSVTSAMGRCMQLLFVGGVTVSLLVRRGQVANSVSAAAQGSNWINIGVEPKGPRGGQLAPKWLRGPTGQKLADGVADWHFISKAGEHTRMVPAVRPNTAVMRPGLVVVLLTTHTFGPESSVPGDL
jgi:hypothetical protein